MISVCVPENMWDGEAEGILVTWLYEDGAHVRENVALAQIMVEKSQFDLMSPSDGQLSIIKQADEIISKGDVLAKLMPF